MSAGEIIAKDIYSTSWKLSEWYIEGNKIKIIGDKSYTLFFNSENNQIHGNSGCNRYFGKYELNGVTLKARDIAGTMMACSPEIMKLESQFRHILETGANLSIEKRELIMENDKNKLIFIADK